MKVIEEIKAWKGKPKELVIFLTENVKKDKALFPQLIEILKTGSDPQRGTAQKSSSTYLKKTQKSQRPTSMS